MIVLTDKNIGEIIKQVINTNEIDDSKTYKEFLHDISDVVVDYFGGDVMKVEHGRKYGYQILIVENESIPDDGGIYKQFK